MKKKDVLNLIKYHYERKENDFRAQASNIARDFSKEGDSQLSEYIMGMISGANVFVPQDNYSGDSFFTTITPSPQVMSLPSEISDDVKGIISTLNKKVGLTKFLFVGKPGTGKTETVKQIARITKKQLLMVDVNSIIDSKLGQTSKNLQKIFEEINSNVDANTIYLFDEMDSLVLDRINNNDLREMGRVTSTFIRLMDQVSTEAIIIATTNLYDDMDKAVTRRFDATISFDRYSNEDLTDIAILTLDNLLKNFNGAASEKKLFKKILMTASSLPNPAQMEKIIRTALAFSNENDPYEYLQRIFKNIHSKNELTDHSLKKLNFTVREIAILLGTSKSTVSRKLSKDKETEK
ncbi:ATP-binding protein [Levilactobacillus brevis]|uniref:ATP-binding protein n=1 Tax=Levilactobacillus brevis TaxID=1580 RepID=UPI001BAD650E|nr:ATP-binding protein [Levilactobacillus brevis]MBS1012484.1 AAA family ATPase [Levilactobacillus brevis]